MFTKTKVFDGNALNWKVVYCFQQLIRGTGISSRKTYALNIYPLGMEIAEKISEVLVIKLMYSCMLGSAEPQDN